MCTVLICAALIGPCGGCAKLPATPSPTAVTTATEEGSTAARVKRVFRYESRVADALLDRYPLREDFAGADPALVAAEARMNDRCGAVTRVVLEKLEGGAPSWVQQLRVMRSLEPCERAARRVEHLLDQYAQAVVANRGL